MNEIWKPISGYHGYEVSNKGNVRSFKPRSGRGELEKQPRPLKSHVTKKGYVHVTMSINGKKSTRFVHHLVLENFVGPRPSGMETRHLDGDQKNNYLENLEWGTSSENTQDQRAHGTFKSFSKLSKENVISIKIRLQSGESQSIIAKDYGVNQNTISNIKTGKSWSHVKIPDQEYLCHDNGPNANAI